MPKRSRKKRACDLNQIAAQIAEKATRESALDRNPAAVALGRLGGLKGGKARAKSLSAKKREEIARLAAAARWKKSDR